MITYNRGKDVHGCMEDLIDQLGLDRQWDSPSTVHRAIDKYIKDNYKGDYDAYILDYYNKKDGTHYTSVNDLLANNEAALTDLNKSGTGEKLHSITFDSPTYYNHFYKNVLSLKVDDSDKLEEFKKDTGVSWNSSGKELTIGDYMYDKLNSTEGAWDKANSYFNALLSSGLNEDEATWAAFALAVNLDGELANNNIQNKPLSWYASMVLHQTDGTLDLTKTDKKTGEIIGDDEGEGQTSFYLWKYETNKKTGEKETKYCTYVEFLFSQADTSYAIFNCRENRERMVTLLHMLLAEADRSLDGCETVCQDLLEVLLIWLVRCTTLSLQLEEAPRTENRECAEIKRYLDTNYREDISLDRLAEIAHLNKYYLAHTFQKEYGVSPITYLNRRRIEESKYMLGNTGYSLAQISELMGFSSPSYFSQCFRKSEGLTPNEYRRQARQGKRPAPAKRHEG